MRSGRGERTGPESDLDFDDLLDARFDDEGRLSQIGRGSRQRIAEQLEPRPPTTGVEELERAVRKLAEGLDAIERQSLTTRPRVRSAAPLTETSQETAAGRDFVTHGLDRLEARLEALSQRLQRNSAEPHATSELAPEPAPEPVEDMDSLTGADMDADDDPSLSAGPDYTAGSAELRRLAELEAERLELEADERRAMETAEMIEAARRQAEAEAEAEAQHRAEAEITAARLQAEEDAAEARRRAEEEAAEAQRRAEMEIAEARRQAEEDAAEARRQAEEEAAEARLHAAEAQRLAEEQAAEAQRLAEAEAAEAERRAEEAEAEARRQAAAVEEERLARMADASREAEAAAETQRQFAEIEARLEALQTGIDENQIEPVREELIELLRDVELLARNQNGLASSFDDISARIGEMESKVNAARNMAGNRLGDIQDRLTGLGKRLDDMEVEVPGYDAIRENQSAILERFDRMEGLVQHVTPPEELFNRVDAIRRRLKTMAAQDDVEKVEQHILSLAERLDALPETLDGSSDAISRIESQLGGLATELADARDERITTAAGLDQRFAELADQLQEVKDLSGLEEQLAEFGARLDEDRQRSGDALTRLERRLTTLATAIEEQENGAAAEILEGLTAKVDALANAIEAQDAPGARRDVEGLGDKLDHLAAQLAEQREHLARAQVAPLETRLDTLQSQLEEIAGRAAESSEQLRPFAQRLQDISERLSTLGATDTHSPLSLRLEAIEERIAALGNGRGPDPRALQTQLEGIISRLELLKGRSIDPARLTELFDRVDATTRALPEDRFDRLERKLADAAITTERFDRLERKLESVGLASEDGGDLTADTLLELREDITALRRELRSMPSHGQDDPGLRELLHDVVGRMDRLPEQSTTAIATLEAQMDRIATLLDDPSHARLAFAHIESSLKTIEEGLADTRRSLLNASGGAGTLSQDSEAEAVAGAAQALAENVSALKESAPAADGDANQALDAVQGTLEAVVKRMAFLERDADAKGEAEAPEKVDTDTTAPKAQDGAEPQTVPSPTEIEAAALVERLESEPAGIDLPEETSEPTTALTDEPPVFKSPDPEGPDTEAAATEEAQASTPRSGGLLGRLTSSQLLRRATGGRAESFTPSQEESEDESDFPLEPGTDSPLTSALTGAPSSDTDNLSGSSEKGRETGLEVAFGDSDKDADTGVDENFLAAARRAARAAADEAAQADAPSAAGGGFGRAIKSRRAALMAAALAVAVAFAAFQIIRTQMNTGGTEVAALPGTAEPSAPAIDTASSTSAGGDVIQAEAAATEPPVAESPVSEPTVGDAMMAERSSPGAPSDTATPDTMASASQTTTADDRTSADEATDVIPSMAVDEAVVAVDQVAIVDQSAGQVTPVSTTGPALPEPPAAMGSQRLRDAAMAGDPSAAFEIAARFAEGTNGRPNMPAAVSWYEQVAQDGLAPAQYRLGSIYEKGLGVPKDLTRAQDWYQRAADAGNVKAMHNLAVLHAEGAGGEPDLELAAALFRQAAEHGVRDSQFNLAILHARGLGVPQDLVEAYKWFSVAATSGDEESAKRREIIGAALSEEDVIKAQAAAANFQPTPLIREANEVLMPDNGWSEQRSSISVEAEPASAADAELGSNLSENDLVALVQKLLTDRGFDPGPTDGLLGQRTIEAILSFQGEAGLPKTGQIDPDLMKALRSTAS